MKTRLLTLLFIISLAFNLGILVKVFLFPHHPGSTKPGNQCEYDNWEKSSKCLKLNLNCHQVQELEKYRTQLRTRIEPLKKKLNDARMQLFLLLKKDTYDESEAERRLEEITTLQKEMQREFITHFFQIKKIFDPSQQERFFFYVGQSLYDEKVTPCSVDERGCEHCK